MALLVGFVLGRGSIFCSLPPPPAFRIVGIGDFSGWYSGQRAWALSARTLDRGFESRLRHGCLSLVFLCCVVLCRYRPCDVLITRPGSPTVCRKT
jgi:hypothetical protein